MEEPQIVSPEVPEEKPKRKLYAEHILLIIALCTAALTIAMVLLCLPYFNPTEDPEVELHRHPQQTQPLVTEAPTEGPTEPPLPEPEKNPYGRMDFQYEGRYLGCIKADTEPGIDVSAYQGDIDWKKVKASGIQFAIIRLGYRGYGTGKLVQDDYAIKNIEAEFLGLIYVIHRGILLTLIRSAGAPPHTIK